jgi:hypothetical protein
LSFSGVPRRSNRRLTFVSKGYWQSYLPFCISTGILRLNGRYDFVKRVQEGQSLLYEYLGTPREDKFWKIYESDHHAPRLERIKEMTAFLDKYLGPVK